MNEAQRVSANSIKLPIDSRFYLAPVVGVGWLAGIWLASAVNLGAAYWCVLGLAAIFGAVALWRRGRWGLALAAGGALALGGARYAASQTPFDPGHVNYYNGATDLVILGEVAAEPDLEDTYSRLRVAASQVIVDGQARPAAGALQVETGRFPVIGYGASVRLTGDLISPEALGNPDYAAYLRRGGIASVMRYPEVEVLAQDGGSPFYRALLWLKDRGRKAIRAALPEPHAALLSGILLGDSSGMPEWLDAAFRETGMTHIIAISGYNIAVLIALLDGLGGPVLPRRVAAVLIMIFIGLYAALVGAAASVVRAAMMGIAYLASLRLMGRPTLAIAGLFTAAIAMTLVHPNALWDVGFQLSFAATLGLMLYAGSWTRRLDRGLPTVLSPDARNRARGSLTEAAVVTLAAQVFTVPLLLFHFGRLSLASLPANILVLPAQPGVMVAGGLLLLAGLIQPVAGQAVSWIAWPFLAYTVSAIDLLSRLPAASVPLSLSLPGLIAIYAAIAALTILAALDGAQRRALLDRIPATRRATMATTGAVLMLALLAIWLRGRPDGRLHVAFLDVGQGDAILIQSPSGQQLLVDGGRYPSVILDELSRQLPFWDRSIDLVLATHPDQDHVAGLVSVLERYRVAGLITNGTDTDGDPAFAALLAAANGRDVAVHHAQVGEIIYLDDGARLDILYVGAVGEGDNRNDSSIVVRLEYGELSLLLTGDAEMAAETTLLQSGRTLDSVILKAGHHGANTSSGAPFLAAVSPQVIVISVGRDNSFGHPSPAMLDRAAATGATILRTDECGTLEVVTDGRQMWWTAEHEILDAPLP
jgi:competence protein ComEC